MPTPAGPPVDVALRDGSTVRVRGVRPEDLDELRELLAGMSESSRWLRFLSAAVDLDKAAQFAADPGDGASLVVTAGSPERIVAHAVYAREDRERAEVAFEVSDAWQKRGIATILLAHLAGLAERDGVTTFTAYIHPTNRRMIGVFRASGFPVEVHADAGELTLEMPAALGVAARARFEDRGRAAAAAAVAHLLRPASVALVGAGWEQGSVEIAVLRNLLAAGYEGALSIVHPELDAVEGIPAHRSVEALPGPAELGVICVPTDAVIALADACGRSGMRALAVASSGFADGGVAGRTRLAELLAVCRRHGMRLLGPSSLGVINTDPALRLNAVSYPGAAPVAGHVAIASQSGAIGAAAIAEAARRGIGLSSFVSTGDKADLSGNDFLQYWEGDPATRVMLLYLESFGNPRRFGAVARRVAASKPIVALKSGRRAVAGDPAATRTRALLSASDVSVDALFEHAGVIRSGTVSEQLDVASLLISQPLPGGDRVGIVSNARGPAIACADAAAAAGLDPAPAVDLGAAATAGDYVAAIGEAAAGCDSLVAIFAPPLQTRTRDVAAGLRDAAGGLTGSGKTLLGVFMAETEAELATLAGDLLVPTYRGAEEAVRALARVTRYASWRARPPDDPPDLAGVSADAVAAIVAAALVRGPGWLHPAEAGELLAAYGVPVSGPPAAGAPGVEMVAGVLADPDFGPLVACGPGGRTVELLGDAAVRLAPLGRREAARLVRSLRSFPLLDGYRDAPKADVSAFEDVLLRISALAAAHPEVAEIDCDPVLVGEAGAVVAGARVRVHAPAGPRPYPALDR